jgi:hypothetical protein
LIVPKPNVFLFLIIGCKGFKVKPKKETPSFKEVIFVFFSERVRLSVLSNQRVNSFLKDLTSFLLAIKPIRKSSTYLT